MQVPGRSPGIPPQESPGIGGGYPLKSQETSLRNSCRERWWRTALPLRRSRRASRLSGATVRLLFRFENPKMG